MAKKLKPINIKDKAVFGALLSMAGGITNSLIQSNMQQKLVEEEMAKKKEQDRIDATNKERLLMRKKNMQEYDMLEDLEFGRKDLYTMGGKLERINPASFKVEGGTHQSGEDLDIGPVKVEKGEVVNNKGVFSKKLKPDGKNSFADYAEGIELIKDKLKNSKSKSSSIVTDKLDLSLENLLQVQDSLGKPVGKKGDAILGIDFGNVWDSIFGTKAERLIRRADKDLAMWNAKDYNFKPEERGITPESLGYSPTGIDSDIASTALNATGNIVGSIIQSNNLSKMSKLSPEEREPLTYIPKDTTINVNPQLNAIDEAVDRNESFLEDNVTNAPSRVSSNMAAELAGAEQKGKILQQKELTETQLGNTETESIESTINRNINRSAQDREAQKQYARSIIANRSMLSNQVTDNLGSILKDYNMQELDDSKLELIKQRYMESGVSERMAEELTEELKRMLNYKP